MSLINKISILFLLFLLTPVFLWAGKVNSAKYACEDLLVKVELTKAQLKDIRITQKRFKNDEELPYGHHEAPWPLIAGMGKEFTVPKRPLFKHKKPRSLTSSAKVSVFKSFKGKKRKNQTIEAHKKSLVQLLILLNKAARALDDRLSLPGESIHDRDVEAIRNLIAERQELVALFLLSQGVNLKLKKTTDEHKAIANILLIEIDIEGEHPFNQKAREIHQEYRGLKWGLDGNLGGEAFFKIDEWAVVSNFREIVEMNADGSSLKHELGHARNYIEGVRDFGLAKNYDGVKLPVLGIDGYRIRQNFDEGEQGLLSIHEESKDILGWFREGRYELAHAMTRNLARHIVIVWQVGLRNQLISEQVEKLVKSNMQEYVEESVFGHLKLPATESNPQVYHRFKKGLASYQSKPYFFFELAFPADVDDPFTETETLLQTRVEHMQKVAHNQMAVLHVARRVADKLWNTKNNEEIITLLKALIKLTEDNFWENDEPLLDEKQLIKSFNDSLET